MPDTIDTHVAFRPLPTAPSAVERLLDMAWGGSTVFLTHKHRQAFRACSAASPASPVARAFALSPAAAAVGKEANADEPDDHEGPGGGLGNGGRSNVAPLDREDRRRSDAGEGRDQRIAQGVRAAPSPVFAAPAKKFRHLLYQDQKLC